jgi:hypothetical protein
METFLNIAGLFFMVSGMAAWFLILALIVAALLFKKGVGSV